MNNRYKSENSLAERKKESERIRYKYPERVPVICERHENSKELVNIDKKKYLVPSDLTITQFMMVIRKRLKVLPESQALYLFVNGKIPPSTALLNRVYDENRDEDGFLYINYASENTFGSLS